MEANQGKDRRKSPRVPVELTVLATFEDRRVSMYSANICRDGMFLVCREFIRPHAIFPAQVWLNSDEEPLNMYMTSCFIESSWAGYGLGVQFSGISSDDNARWSEFYRGCVEAAESSQPRLPQLAGSALGGHILVVGNAVHTGAMAALRNQGLAVSYVPTVEEAIDTLRRQPIDVVVCDLRRPGLDGLALCCHIKGHKLPTHTVLLTGSSTPREFLLGLYAGASRVIAKPCGNDLLASRIRELLQAPRPAGRAPVMDERAYRTTDEAIVPLSVGSSPAASIDETALARPIKQRVSECLDLAYRYVSGRFLRRQAA